MNTKGVEDGMSDEQAVRQVYSKILVNEPKVIYPYWVAFSISDGRAMFIGQGISKHFMWADARSKLPQPALPVEPPEELPIVATLRRENAQASAVPVEERTAEMEHVEVGRDRVCICGHSRSEHYYAVFGIDECKYASCDGCDQFTERPKCSLSPEMEMTICQLRELAKNADYLAGASPAAINRLLDHIEGKAKAEEPTK